LQFANDLHVLFDYFLNESTKGAKIGKTVPSDEVITRTIRFHCEDYETFIVSNELLKASISNDVVVFLSGFVVPRISRATTINRSKFVR
jgi:hypothetical protein